MAIDIALLDYTVYLISESGGQYNLDKTVTALTWEEQEGQLAQKATLTVAADDSAVNLRSLLKLNRAIRIYCDWGEGKKMVFEGFVWEWSYQHGQQKALSVTVYDPMIKLQQSKDHKYFSAGMDTKAIIGSICGDLGVGVSYKWVHSITHEKKVFNADAISDMILELLEEVRLQTGSPYIALYRNGGLEINAYGTNTAMYKFGGDNTISTSDTLSMNDLVTRVKVIGKADDDDRSSVDAVLDGNLDFGLLQEIVTRDSDKDLGTAKAEAQTILKERGQPEETIMVTSPDLPFIRKGDAVEMNAGNLIGVFYVLGVSHNAATRQMTMTLMRQPGGSAAGSSNDSGSSDSSEGSGEYEVGDAIILNGPVYNDSYGNGKGRTFTDYKSTITIKVSMERACPYHVGQVGWVYPNEITKA